MIADQFRNAHKLRPFKPFSIRAASGESYHVGHPEALWQSPGGQTVIVGMGGEAVAMIDISHITEFVFGRKKAAPSPKGE
jgi:hypothetical protein